MSGLSTLTHVTGIEDDQMRSAMGSLVNLPNSTPHSSVPTTPISSQNSPLHDGIPALASVAAKDCANVIAQPGFLALHNGKAGSGTPLQRAGTKAVAELESPASFYTSSPAATLGARRDFQPPIHTRTTVENWDGINTEVKSPVYEPPKVQRKSLEYPLSSPANRSLHADSDGSASAGSIEVSEIMEGKTNTERYDTGGYNSDEEDADDGDDEEDEDDIVLVNEEDDEDEDDGQNVRVFLFIVQSRSRKVLV